VLTFDYLGALAVSLLFPLVLAPKLGLSRTASCSACSTSAWRFGRLALPRRDPPLRGRLTRGGLVILLAGGLLLSDRLTHWAEQGLFGDDIVFARSTPYQRIVVTRWQDDIRLYLNGNLQFSSRDEHRYHEALVHPALAALPWARSGAGAGRRRRPGGARNPQIPTVERVTLVDLDPEMTDLFTTQRRRSPVQCRRPARPPRHGHQRRRRPVAGRPMSASST
jgi:spermidine synthase